MLECGWLHLILTPLEKKKKTAFSTYSPCDQHRFSLKGSPVGKSGVGAQGKLLEMFIILISRVISVRCIDEPEEGGNQDYCSFEELQRLAIFTLNQ